MNSGIYSITNKSNGKRYIGRSVNLKKRKGFHKWQLEKGIHFNHHLQRAWNNGDEFSFEVLEYCTPEELNEREIYWIAYYDSMHTGYNMCAGGAATLGRLLTDETKRKISASNKGRKCSRETVERRKRSLKEHIKNDPEFARKLFDMKSERVRGIPSWNKGIPCPEWKKQLLSQKLKGRYVSPEHKEKLRELYSGENSITAKLTKRDVVMIRYRFLNGERQYIIWKDYPMITRQTMYDICRGRRWQSVPMSIDELEAIVRGSEV